jgi:hypothetical protein
MASLQQNWKREQNRFCLEAKWVGGKGRGRGRRGRNGPNNVCTFEYINKKILK